jgi:hypothetical protein
MTENPETLETRLAADLATLGDRFADDEFSTELYRALANTKWRRDGGDDEGVALSWSRAEDLVNRLRQRCGRDPLELAQTGGEGERSDLVADELGRLGWRAESLDTGRHDDRHLSHPESPPPKGTGERQAPVGDSHEWERRAHAEADENRR